MRRAPRAAASYQAAAGRRQLLQQDRIDGVHIAHQEVWRAVVGHQPRGGAVGGHDGVGGIQDGLQPPRMGELAVGHHDDVGPLASV